MFFFFLFLILLCCYQISCTSVYSSIARRNRREGFGPFEAQEVWNEIGQSTIKETIDNSNSIFNQTLTSLIDIYTTVGEEAKIVYTAIQHPLDALLSTNLGIALLIFLLLIFITFFLTYFIPNVFKICCLIFRFIKSIWNLLVKLCSWFFTAERFSWLFTNCIIMRFRKWRWESNTPDEILLKSQKKIFKGFVKRTYSKVKTDEHGVYLEATAGHRVYLDQENVVNELTMLQIPSNPPARNEGDVTIQKEALIPNSELWQVDDYPAFQGQFEVGGMVVGHFSRIKYENRDCILTAMHVLEYNKRATVYLRKGDKLVSLDTIKCVLLAGSEVEHLDYVILAVPPGIFSQLGVKCGSVSTRVIARDSVKIYHEYDNEKYFSIGQVTATGKPWCVSYQASTVVGTSGAPLVSQGKIIGVHLEYDRNLKANVGVIPPAFRNRRKESPTNESLFQELEEDDFETSLQNDDISVEDKLLHFYKLMGVDDYRGDNWVEALERRNQNREDKYDLTDVNDPENFRKGYKYYSNSQHKGSLVKQGKIRKEAIWTCEKCFVLQNNYEYNCVACKHPLVKLTKKMLKTNFELAAAVVTNKFRENNIPEEIIKKIVDIFLLAKDEAVLAKDLESIIDTKIKGIFIGKDKIEVPEQVNSVSMTDDLALSVATSSKVSPHDIKLKYDTDKESLVLEKTHHVMCTENSHPKLETNLIATVRVVPTDPIITQELIDNVAARAMYDVATPVNPNVYPDVYNKLQLLIENQEKSRIGNEVLLHSIEILTKQVNKLELDMIPLNLKTPVSQTGAPITSGPNLQAFQAKVSPSADPLALARAPRRKKNRKSGKSSAKRTQNMEITAGQSETQ